MTSSRRPAQSRGQALVEFALVIPMFLLLVFGIVDAGRLIYTYNTLANAARDAARVAVVSQALDGTISCDTTTSAYAVGCAISSAQLLGLTASDVDVQFLDANDAPCSPLRIGCVAVVETSGQFRPLTPVISSLIPTLTLKSTSKMPIERVCSTGC